MVHTHKEGVANGFVFQILSNQMQIDVWGVLLGNHVEPIASMLFVQCEQQIDPSSLARHLPAQAPRVLPARVLHA